jgi:DNA helicase TIP49 (TBP-interacting protein)
LLEEAVEQQQQQVKGLHSVVDLKRSSSDRWEYLPDGEVTKPEECWETISFLDLDVEQRKRPKVSR